MSDPNTEKTEVYRIKRDGDRDLRFSGSLLGTGEHGTGGTSGDAKDWIRSVKVSIYRTIGGDYVVSTRGWSSRQGEHGSRGGGLYRSPKDLLAGLRDKDGLMGAAEKKAWEEACQKDDALAAIETEQSA